MKPPSEIRTERLVLRAWRDEDLPFYAAMSADPRVMEHFPSVLTERESFASAAKIRATNEERGFGLWAAEAPGIAPFIGFIGLWVPTFEAHFTPCVEVGWRLAHEHWGRGYAPEGARAALRFAFETLGLHEVVALTTTRNLRSQRVMEKIGMTRHPSDDFEHPSLVEGHPLRPHVLYRLSRGA